MQPIKYTPSWICLVTLKTTIGKYMLKSVSALLQKANNEAS